MVGWLGLDAAINITLGLTVFIAVTVYRLDAGVRLIRRKQDRLTLTFFKIESDLDAIQNGLVCVASAQGTETMEAVLKHRELRQHVFEFRHNEGPTLGDILRGLEFPDVDDDKRWWDADRRAAFGFSANSEQNRS